MVLQAGAVSISIGADDVELRKGISLAEAGLQRFGRDAVRIADRGLAEAGERGGAAFSRGVTGHLATLERRYGQHVDTLQRYTDRLSMATGAALLGIGAAALAAGAQVQRAQAIIRAGTGARDASLDRLMQSWQAVAAVLPNSMEQVAETIAELNTRTGATGPALENLAIQVLNLARISNTSLNSVIQSTTRLFGDWNVATKDQAGTLDLLWRVSQSTGIAVDRLAGSLVQYGAPLRQVGFDLERSAALMGRWEKEGVNMEAILGSLRIALNKFAEEGRDAPNALQELIASIRRAESDAKGIDLARSIMGGRAAADFAAAVREGRFELDELVASLRNSDESISRTAAETLSLSEQFTILQRTVAAALQPLGSEAVVSLQRLQPTLQSGAEGIARLIRQMLEMDRSGKLVAGALLGIAVGAGPATRAIRTTTLAVRGLSDATTLLAGKTGLASLAIGATPLGLAVLGLGALAAAFLDAKRRAAEARIAAQETIDALATASRELEIAPALGRERALESELATIQALTARLEQARARLPQLTIGTPERGEAVREIERIFIRLKRMRPMEQIEAELGGVRERLKELRTEAAQFSAAADAGLASAAGSAGTLATGLSDAAKEALKLLDLLEQRPVTWDLAAVGPPKILGFEIDPRAIERARQEIQDKLQLTATLDLELKQVARAPLPELPRGARIGPTPQEIEQFVHATQAGAELARSLGDLADAFGDAADALPTLLRAVETGFQGASRVRAAQAPGVAGTLLGTLGMFSGGLSIAAGAVGAFTSILNARREAEARARTATEQTALSLDRLRANLQGITASADRLQRAMQVGTALQRTLANPWDFSWDFGKSVEANVRSFGLSMAEFRKIIEETGIRLLDEQGRIDLSQVGAFIEALREHTIALTGFTDTLAEQRSRLTLQRKIEGGDTTPVQELQDWIELLRGRSTALFERFFQGIDVSTREGQEQAREALRKMFAAFDTGGEEFAALMKGLTREEIIQFFNGAADSINALGDSADKATRGMQNVPTIFRLSARAFQAAVAGIQEPARVRPPRTGEVAPPIGRDVSESLQRAVEGIPDAIELTIPAGQLASLQEAVRLGVVQGFVGAPGAARGEFARLDLALLDTAPLTRAIEEGLRPGADQLATTMQRLAATLQGAPERVAVEALDIPRLLDAMQQGFRSGANLFADRLAGLAFAEVEVDLSGIQRVLREAIQPAGFRADDLQVTADIRELARVLAQRPQPRPEPVEPRKEIHVHIGSVAAGVDPYQMAEQLERVLIRMRASGALSEFFR